MDRWMNDDMLAEKQRQCILIENKKQFSLLWWSRDMKEPSWSFALVCAYKQEQTDQQVLPAHFGTMTCFFIFSKSCPPFIELECSTNKLADWLTDRQTGDPPDSRYPQYRMYGVLLISFWGLALLFVMFVCSARLVSSLPCSGVRSPDINMSL